MNATMGLAHRRPGGSGGGPAAAAARASGTARASHHDGVYQASQQRPTSKMTSATRIAAAAANNDRRIVTWVDKFEFLSTERVKAVEGWQSVASALPSECASCGVKNPNMVPHTVGCDKHLICGDCDPCNAMKASSPMGFVCAARGCSTTVFNIKPIRLGNISCLRSKIDEALRVEQHACQMDDTRAQIANDGNSSDEDGDGAAGGKRKRGKMDADKAAAMKSKRRNTMQQKKEELKRQLEQGERAIHDLAAARIEIDQLKAHISMLQMQMQQEQPTMDETPEMLVELDLGELMAHVEAMDAEGC